MPWMETPVPNQRLQFLADYERKERPVAQLARQYAISRKTAYKWIARYAAEGPAGLVDASRAPKHHPQQVPEAMVEQILALRDEFGWGARKLRVMLEAKPSERPWPAISTIEQILKDHGRVIGRPKRRRVPVQSQPFVACDGPNSLWCCDFKGHFLTGDGQRVYPLTITDAFSRYVLCCQALEHCDYESVRPIFRQVFQEYGLPVAIRSDNGPPFASRAVAGLSRLSVEWIKLGIVVERIDPGHPEQNGRHERMHLTLKQETASPPAGTWRAQQQRFEAWRQRFNHVRPHEALGMATPASVYGRSPRPCPAQTPSVVYPAGWPTRRVQCDGDFWWQHQPVFLSEVLAGEPVGLERVDERYWRVWLGPVWLGVFDSQTLGMLRAAQVRRRGWLRPDSSQARPSAALQDAPARE